MSAPLPWSVQWLYGNPTIVDAEGYTVVPIGGVNATMGDTAERLMAQIVLAVNAAGEKEQPKCGAPDYFAPGIICKLALGHDGPHCGDNCPEGMCNTCERG